MNERKRGLTLADVNGYVLPEPPEKFPLVITQSEQAAVTMIVSILWAGNADFQKMCLSIDNKSARSKSLHQDKGQAAQAIWNYAKANKVEALTVLDEPEAKARIARHWLRNALKKAGLDRQSLLLAAKAEGEKAAERREAAAAARQTAKDDEPQADQPQA